MALPRATPARDLVASAEEIPEKVNVAGGVKLAGEPHDGHREGPGPRPGDQLDPGPPWRLVALPEIPLLAKQIHGLLDWI